MLHVSSVAFHRAGRRSGFVALALVVAAGCMQTGATGDDGADGGLPENAQRSTTCLEYQRVRCEYAADRCGQMSRSECDAQARSLYCAHDSVVRACIDELRLAGCQSMPAACDDVVDREPAIYICNRVSTKVCTARARCGLETRDACLQQLKLTVPCDQAQGIEPSIDACMLRLDQVSCTALAANDLPPDCVGVVVF